MADEYYTNTTETGEPSDSGELDVVGPVDEEGVDPTGQGAYQESAESGSGNQVRTFTEQPTPPYSVGDIWLREDGDYSCVASKPVITSGTSVLVEGYAGALHSVAIDGKCTQDGEPAPATPVPITYLTGTLAIAVDGTTAFTIDIAANRLCSLPSGIVDAISVDANGEVTITKRVGFTTTAATDGITGTVGFDVLSSTGEIADGADVYYELPVYELLGFGSVTMATVSSGDAVTAVPETNITVGYGAFAQSDWVPNFAEPEDVPMVTKPMTRSQQIEDFSPEALQELADSGAVAVGFYQNGSAEIHWEDVEPPVQQNVMVIDEALEAAKATNQHFWHDDNGAHVATVTTTGDAVTTLYGDQVEIEAVSAVPLKSLVVYGESEQVGVPSATSPIPIASVEGTNGNLSLVIDRSTPVTVSIPIGSEKLCSLPNNVRDTISVDAAGAVTLTKNVGYTNRATTEGISATIGVDAMSSTGTLADGADVYYALQTPVVTTLAPIAMPTVSDGDLLAIDHTLTPGIEASWVSGTEPVGDGDAGYNSLWNSMGMFFRRAANYLVSITRSAIAFYDGQGNEAENIVARFGSAGAQIGKSNSVHTVLSNGVMSVYDNDVAMAEFGSSPATITTSHTWGEITSDMYDGGDLVLSFPRSPILGIDNPLFFAPPAGGPAYAYNVEECIVDLQNGTITVPSSLSPSGVLGYYGNASYRYSGHVAYGSIGERDGEIGAGSFTAGAGNSASGEMSAAFGSGNDANGECSAVFGTGNIANSADEFVAGRFATVNDDYATSPRYIFKVGCGSSIDARDNAFAVEESSGGVHHGTAAEETAMHANLASRHGRYIRIVDGDQYGSAVLLGAGGMVIVGSGESADNLFAALTEDPYAPVSPANETLHLASDGSINLHANCNSSSAANRKTVSISTTGEVVAPANIVSKSLTESDLRIKAETQNYAVSLRANTSGICGVWDETGNQLLVGYEPDGLKLFGLNFSLQTKNKVLIAPSNGSGQPTFRALVEDDLPTVPVDKGGTGDTGVTTITKISDICTASSGVNIVSASYSTWGKVAQVNIAFTLDADLAGNGVKSPVCNIVSGKRPKKLAGGCTAYMVSNLNTNGNVICRNASNSTLAAGTQREVSFTYLLP